MLDADANVIARLWITVPPEQDIDQVAQYVSEATGVIAAVNDRGKRWICVGAPGHRVTEVRKTLVRLGYLSQEK